MSTFASAATLDIPRARKVLEHLVAHPEEHDQNFYGQRLPCGTTACIAGTVLLMDPDADVRWEQDMRDMISASVNGGDHQEPDEAAAELLGLSRTDSDHLFFTMDKTKAITTFAAWISAAEVVQS